MPPVNQGSKAGLITSLILSVILLMVAVIMWVTINTDLTKKTTEYNNLKKQYEKVARTDQLVADSGDVSLIDVAKEKLNLTGAPTTIDVALAEITHLTTAITGGAGSQNYAEAETRAADAVTKALAYVKEPTAPAPTSAPAGTTAAMPAGESLLNAIEKLEQALNQAAKTNATWKGQLDDVNKNLATRVEAWNAQVKELEAKVAEGDKRAADSQTKLAEAQAMYSAKQTEADTSNKTTVDTTGKQITEMQTAVAQAKAETAKANAEINTLRGQLAFFRNNVKDASIRAADGTVIRVPSSTSCYISLGSGDHLPAGTTFEVYDKTEGVPALGKDPLSENDMPKGKGSIEVVKVGQNSSECRIVHLQPTMTLSEGDIIGNLVYNRNTTFNFFVYGNFDVDGNGIWTAQEAEVIKSLVTRWGGKVQDKISVSTDFVVLGQEPEVPILTAETKDDAVMIDKVAKAKAAKEAYDKVVNDAATLHIPVLNQNRFMYYIGYYDQMKR